MAVGSSTAAVGSNSTARLVETTDRRKHSFGRLTKTDRHHNTPVKVSAYQVHPSTRILRDETIDARPRVSLTGMNAGQPRDCDTHKPHVPHLVLTCLVLVAAWGTPGPQKSASRESAAAWMIFGPKGVGWMLSGTCQSPTFLMSGLEEFPLRLEVAGSALQ